jgi:hypothetical protein
MSAKEWSLVITTCLLVGLLIHRRVVFALNTLGVFVMSYLVFVDIGVLALPWVQDSLSMWFPAFRYLHLITESQMVQAMVLVTGGIFLVVLSYMFSHFVSTGGKLLLSGPNLLRTQATRRLGFSPIGLGIFGGTALLLACGYAVSKGSVLFTGIEQGFIGGDPSSVLASRRGVTDSYIYVQLSYNIVPFCGVATWLWYLLRGGPWLRAYAITYNILAAGLLVLLFQKRPLVLFLGSLVLVSLWVYSGKRGYSSVFADRQSRRKLLKYGSLTFALLMGLYFLHTTIGRNGEGILSTIGTLSEVVILRVVGRLAMPAAMYVHYFPNVESHYGFSNIGLLSSLLDLPAYADTPVVFEYFTGSSNGAVAASSLMDFYGAFGWFGWFVGSMLLGLLLYRLDLWLMRLEFSGSTMLAVVFSFIFVYYLSQASVPRASLGYGGGVFLAIWLLIRTSRVRTSAEAKREVVPDAKSCNCGSHRNTAAFSQESSDLFRGWI